jgi:uncharacterized OB-fold protein
VIADMTQQQATTIECFKCNNCGNTTLARKKICPKCGSADIVTIQSEGKGEVVDFVTIYFPPHNYKDIAPYNSLKVRLDNGCMAFGVIEGEGKDIPLGSRVTMIKHDEATGGLFFGLD